MDNLHQSEGDINTSPQREQWQERQLNAETRDLLAQDARYFLKQSLSTPCLNTMSACDGIYIQDSQGRRYMDFHGNNVHQVGFGNPEVIAAINTSSMTYLFVHAATPTRWPLPWQKNSPRLHRPR